VIGFDLIGQEDTGDPLNKYMNQLSDLPSTANYFFHAGETSMLYRQYYPPFITKPNPQIGMGGRTGT